MRTSDDDGVGIVVNYENEGNYYLFEMDLQRNFSRIVRVYNGQGVTLATGTQTYQVNTGHRLTFTAENGVLSAAIDGTDLFGPVADTALSGGTVGLFSWANAGVFYDDLDIRTATVLPNQTPVAQADAFRIDEDEPLAITLADLLDNDSDADLWDVLTLASFTPVGTGNLTFDTTAETFTYTPPADWNGVTTFTYAVTDGELTDDATVTLSIDAVNDAPVASDDTLSTNDAAPSVVIAVADLLGNDSDVDLDTLSLTVDRQPRHGTVTVNASGDLVYTPTAGFVATDTFIYRVADPAGLSDTGKVTLRIALTPPPLPLPPVVFPTDSAEIHNTGLTSPRPGRSPIGGRIGDAPFDGAPKTGAPPDPAPLAPSGSVRVIVTSRRIPTSNLARPGLGGGLTPATVTAATPLDLWLVDLLAAEELWAAVEVEDGSEAEGDEDDRTVVEAESQDVSRIAEVIEDFGVAD
jgi:hypothetical protein